MMKISPNRFNNAVLRIRAFGARIRGFGARIGQLFSKPSEFEKATIADVLQSRMKVKIIGALLILLMATLSFQLIIGKFPKKSKAATQTVTQSGDTLTLDGDFIISGGGTYLTGGDTVLGDIIDARPGGVLTKESHNYNVLGRDVVIGGGTTSFAGGTVSMKSLKVLSDGIVTHIGPGPTATTLQTMPADYFGILFDGYIKAQNGGKFRVTYNNNNDYIRIEVRDAPGGSLRGSYDYQSDYTEVTTLTADAWYYFKIYFLEKNGEAKIKFELFGDSNLEKADVQATTDVATAGKINVQYYYSNDTSYFDDNDFVVKGITNGTKLYDYFSTKNLASGHFVQSFVGSWATIDWGNSAPAAPPDLLSARRLDLSIAGDLTIEATGKIDVSGKGYQGGAFNTSSDGSGLGGGQQNKSNSNAGGGGGYGGKGGSGLNIGSDNYAKGGGAYDSSTEPNDLGSGGGSGEWGGGGAGGGIIKIVANQIITKGENAFISNGANGPASTESEANGGAGSGGTINLQANTLNISGVVDTSTLFSAKGGSSQKGSNVDEYGGSGSGGRIAIRYASSNKLYENLYRYSNATDVWPLPWDDRGYFDTSPVPSSPNTQISRIDKKWVILLGEQGTVYIFQEAGGSIQKTLTAKDRGGSSTFNPYALQVGDKITVTITVPNLVAGTPINLTDDILKLPDGTHKCVPVISPNSISDSGAYIPVDKVVSWTNYIPIFSESYGFTYDCVVE